MLAKIVNDIIEKDLNNIIVFTHKYPDYDALCSTATISAIIYDAVLNTKYPNLKNCSIDECMKIIQDEKTNLPTIIPFVQSQKLGEYQIFTNVLLYEGDELKELDKNFHNTFDAVIVCDVNEEDRVYKHNGTEEEKEIMNRLLSNIKQENVYLIDHHFGNRKELNILPENKLSKTASSTCELIVKDALKDGININSRYMRDIYAGIISDTCCFMFGVDDLTERIQKEEIFGLDEEWKNKIEGIFSKLYEEDTRNLEKLKKLDTLGNKINIYYIDHPEIAKERGTYINSAVEKAIKPKEGEISVLICNFDGYTELKFRKDKNSNISISELAKIFNGGGHEERSAARVTGKNLEEIIEQLLTNICEVSGKQPIKRK